MVSAIGFFLMLVACSPIHRIPAPEPPPSVVPPSTARAHYLRGQLHAAGGDLDAAEYSLNRARIFDAEAPRILMALGAVSMTRGDIERARKRFADAAQMTDMNVQVWLEHGRMELAFGDKHTGRTALEYAIQLGEPWKARAMLAADALRSKQVDDAAELIAAWVVQTPSGPNELRRRADLRLMADDVVGSVDDYLEAIRLSVHDLSLVAPLVRASSMGGEIAHAVIGVDSLLAENPAGVAAWMAMGMLSSLIGDHEQTIVGFENAERLGATLGRGARMTMDSARVAQEQGANGPSTPAESVPTDPIGRALSFLAGQQWDAAEAEIVASLNHQPTDHRLLYIMSQIHLERDGALAATPWVERLVASAPDFPPGLNLWAWVHAEQDLHLSEAESFARSALSGQPQVADYWDTLGWVLMLQNKHADAMAILERAVRMLPNDGAVRARRDSCRATLEGSLK